MGGNVRALPRTIYHQSQQADGHMASVAVGALHEVTLDGDGITVGNRALDIDAAADRELFLFLNAMDGGQATAPITTDPGSVRAI